MTDFIPIVSHLKTRVPYRFIGGNTFENLHTGQQGEVSDELSSKVFSFDLNLTEMVNDYPEVLNLLKLGFIVK